jgi:hypothetical protein
MCTSSFEPPEGQSIQAALAPSAVPADSTVRPGGEGSQPRAVVVSDLFRRVGMLLLVQPLTDIRSFAVGLVLLVIPR